MLADPLVVVRGILLADPAVADATGGQVYATPSLPVGHTYPCIRLTHIGEGGYAPVGFRHSAVAGVQMDVWSYDQAECAHIAGLALDVLHSGPSRVTFEARELDESVQPPLHRYRADLSVRVQRVVEVQ